MASYEFNHFISHVKRVMWIVERLDGTATMEMSVKNRIKFPDSAKAVWYMEQ